MEAKATGASYPAVSDKIIKESRIPLSPLEEQKKIAAILDAADDYRQKTKALIDKYDQLTQSLFLDMFGDHLNNSKGWDIVELNTVVELVTKGTTPTSLGDKFSDSGIKFLRAQNVLDGKVIIDEDILFIDKKTHFTKLKRSHIRKGDVLLTIAGTIGRTAIVEVNEELNCNQAIAIIRLGNSTIHPIFLCYFFASNGAQSQFSKGKVTATISNLSLSQIKKLQIPTPHISIQRKFAERVAQIEKQKQQAEASLIKAEELFSSLLQRAFKGELTS
jgi:type I restriction enzyme S subunit